MFGGREPFDGKPVGNELYTKLIRFIASPSSTIISSTYALQFGGRGDREPLFLGFGRHSDREQLFSDLVQYV